MKGHTSFGCYQFRPKWVSVKPPTILHPLNPRPMSILARQQGLPVPWSRVAEGRALTSPPQQQTSPSINLSSTSSFPPLPSAGPPQQQLTSSTPLPHQAYPQPQPSTQPLPQPSVTAAPADSLLDMLQKLLAAQEERQAAALRQLAAQHQQAMAQMQQQFTAMQQLLSMMFGLNTPKECPPLPSLSSPLMVYSSQQPAYQQPSPGTSSSSSLAAGNPLSTSLAAPPLQQPPHHPQPSPHTYMQVYNHSATAFNSPGITANLHLPPTQGHHANAAEYPQAVPFNSVFQGHVPPPSYQQQPPAPRASNE